MNNKFGPYAHAAIHLQNGLRVLKTNVPINMREGRVGQSNLEKQEIKSFELALQKLKEASSAPLRRGNVEK